MCVGCISMLYDEDHLENAFRRIKHTVKASARDYLARGKTGSERFEIRRGSALGNVCVLKKQSCEQTVHEQLPDA